MDIRSPRLVVALLAFVVGCDSPTQADPTFEPAIVTDGNVFTVGDFGVMRQGWIPHTFTNRTEGPIFIVNCNGEFEMVLERKVGNTWQPFWQAIVDTCLSPPIEIEAGETLTKTLFIYGFAPDDNQGPTLAPESGPFRIRWGDLVYTYEPAPPWGEPIPEELRISNEFDLVFE